jgi:hypothetical protein
MACYIVINISGVDYFPHCIRPTYHGYKQQNGDCKLLPWCSNVMIQAFACEIFT